MSSKIFMLILAMLLIAIALSGCNTTNRLTQTIDQTQIIVAEPPRNLYNCPQIRKSDIPDPDTATNQQIAEFIRLYDYNLRLCGINMTKIREYIDQAKLNNQGN